MEFSSSGIINIYLEVFSGSGHDHKFNGIGIINNDVTNDAVLFLKLSFSINCCKT